MNKRADQLLVDRKLASTLDEAARLILAGCVLLPDKKVQFAGQLLDEQVPITVKKSGRFVSRGGDKLFGFIADLGLEAKFQDVVVIDVGSSTGGFTDCALQLGAKTVWAVDVGSNQLAWSLRQNPKVVVQENTHIANLSPPNDVVFDVVLADVSFHSLRALLPSFLKLPVHGDSAFLLLVKPQFELSRKDVPKGGVIDDPQKSEGALQAVIQVFEQAGFVCNASLASRVKGQKGNQEFFIYLTLLPQFRLGGKVSP